jgi:hypothetical protein
MEKVSKAQKLIDEAIAAINRELESTSLPEAGPRSRKQLEEFLVALMSMKKKISGEEYHTKDEIYGYGIGQAIIDSWPDYDQLGNIIIAAEQGYVNAIHGMTKPESK